MWFTVDKNKGDVYGSLKARRTGRFPVSGWRNAARFSSLSVIAARTDCRSIASAVGFTPWRFWGSLTPQIDSIG